MLRISFITLFVTAVTAASSPAQGLSLSKSLTALLGRDPRSRGRARRNRSAIRA